MLDTAVNNELIRAIPVRIKGAAVEKTIERPILAWDDVRRVADAIHPGSMLSCGQRRPPAFASASSPV